LGSLVGNGERRSAPQHGHRASARRKDASSRHRTAGKLGCGGGPGGPAPLFPPLPQAKVLEEAKGDHRHERVPVQAGPGATLEVVEAEFLLELLVRLLAHPTGLDGRCQLLERDVRRQVREMVLPLAGGPVLTDQPDLCTRWVPTVAELFALGRAHPQGRELGHQRPLGPAPPVHPPPKGIRQHGLGRDRVLARHRVLARAACSRSRPVQPDFGRVDVLHPRNADCPDEAALAQALPESGAHAVAGVGQDAAEAGAGGQHAIDLPERQVRLGQGVAVFFRHPGSGATLRVSGPRLRQEQLQAHRHRDLAAGQSERDQHLAVGPLAQGTAVLPAHPDRVPALLGQGGVVDHHHGVRPADKRVRLLDQEPAQRCVVPARAGNEVVELVVPAQPETGRHRLQALPLALSEQAPHIDRRP
jgi:hypothetical protein